jgi:hypothetical protein
MKKNKLNQYESKSASEPLPEQIKQAREWSVNRIMEVVDKLKNLPPSNLPLPSWAEIIDELKNGSIHRQPTRIISGASEKKDENFVTKNNSGDAEKKDENFVTKFSDDELRILESLKDG